MSYSELKENELKSLLNAAENKEKNKTRKILVFLVVFALGFCPMCFYYWYTSSYWKSQREITIGNIVIALLVALFLGVISILMLQYLDECKIEMFKSKLIGLGIEDAKKNVDEDIYQNLIKISYKYLDEYYLQMRQQAQKGFFVSCYSRSDYRGNWYCSYVFWKNYACICHNGIRSSHGIYCSSIFLFI